DTGEAQRLIKTFQRKGVRFVGALRVEAPSLGAATGEPPLQRPSIAILPFANLGVDADYISDGITEDIIIELSRFSELLVIARNSSLQYKGKARMHAKSAAISVSVTSWKAAFAGRATVFESRPSSLMP